MVSQFQVKQFRYRSVVSMVACVLAATFSISSALAAADSAAQKKAEKDCEDAAKQAQQACQQSGTGAGMTPNQQQQQQQLQQQQTQNNQQTQQTGAQQAAQCKQQADLGKIMSALSALTGAACLGSVGSCKSACNGNGKKEPTNDPEPSTDGGTPQPNLQSAKMKQTGQKCDSLSGNGAAALAQAAMQLASAMMAQKCADQAATLTPTPAQDCTNPDYAKTNIMCICQNDPKNSMCQKGEQFGSGISLSGGPVGPSSPLGADSGTASDGTPVGGFVGQAKPSSGSATADGGGGGIGGGGGRQQGINGQGEGGDRAGAPASVIQGASSSSGGGLGGSGGFGGGSARGGGGREKGVNGMSLKDFLPKRRDLANVHGITGALGPSLFEKVTNQYQLQKRNMIQDR